MNDYLTAQQGMSQAFNLSAKPLEAFNKKTYHGSFEDFYRKMLPAFDAIEQLYTTVGEPEAMIANMADALTGQAKGAVDGTAKRGARDSLMMNLNMQLAVYVFPAILHYKGESSQPLVDAIGKKWKEAFPKSNVRPAEVEFIEKGFHRKFCYITTAVCQSLGRADDCYELTLLRAYRDDYLAGTPEGEKAITAYYDVAPTIVKHINALEEAPSVYQGIYEGYLQPCIRLIEEGKNEECAARYLEMVCDMKERYFIS